MEIQIGDRFARSCDDKIIIPRTGEHFSDQSIRAGDLLVAQAKRLGRTARIGAVAGLIMLGVIVVVLSGALPISVAAVIGRA